MAVEKKMLLGRGRSDPFLCLLLELWRGYGWADGVRSGEPPRSY